MDDFSTLLGGISTETFSSFFSLFFICLLFGFFLVGIVWVIAFAIDNIVQLFRRAT